MSETSAIEWTNSTWNPVRGCTKVSAGCKHCYAETFAERFRGVNGHPYEQGFDIRLVPEALDMPRLWRRPRRVFVNSMSDLFHEDVPFDFIEDVFTVMAETPHVYQVLTKRAARMREFAEWLATDWAPVPLPNVWFGVSVEDQAAADQRIPHLLATPAAVRFLSCEPLLGPVRLPCIVPPHPGLHWVIAGGESGPGARACDVAWVRSLVEQCRGGGVPVFVKQLGALPVMDAAAWRELAAAGPAPLIRPDAPDGYVRLALRDRKGGESAEWPEDLRVREMPRDAGRRQGER